MDPRISVIVPFYNEESNVLPLAAEIRAVFERLDDHSFECIFVNDGSSDGTRRALDALAERDPRIRPIHLRQNSGQSAAIITGLRRARGAFLFTLDGDLQNDPADIPAMLERLDTHDCVCGYRANRRDTWVRRLSSKVANAVRNAILHDGIRDAGCGSKGFRRHCVHHLMPFNGSHRFIAAQLRAAGMSIAEYPVNHRPREHGQSKYGINNRLWRGIYDLIGVGWLTRRYVIIEAEPGEE